MVNTNTICIATWCAHQTNSFSKLSTHKWNFCHWHSSELFYRLNCDVAVDWRTVLVGSFGFR
jgi:hypothetical protein